MTNTAKTLLGILGTNDFLIPLVLDDITDDDARRRSRGEEGPSISWTLGHLLHHRHQFMALLGVEREDPYAERFSQPATSGDGYPTLAALREEWGEVGEALRSALEGATEETFDASVSSGDHGEQTVRDKVAFLAFHEAYHMGSIGAMRKAMGKPGPAERVMALRQSD